MSVDLHLAESFVSRHGAAAARVLTAVGAARAADFLASVETAAAASMMAQMPPREAASCILEMEEAKAADILHSVGVQRCVLVLRRLERDSRDSVVSRLPDGFAAKVERRLRYPRGSAGWLADSSADPFPATLAVADARKRDLDPRFPYVYLVDSDQKLVGAVHAGDIMTGPEKEPLRTIAKPATVRVSARTGAAELRKLRAWAHLDVLPVVDSRGVYIGAVRHKTLRELAISPSVDDTVETPLASFLDLAEMYWLGLASIVVPTSRWSHESPAPESPHET